MTSYDDRANHDDLDPAYGIHLHDPRMMENMGAPESARLLGRTPEYWLEHMDRERTVQAALRLHHDASLIMTNVQIMSQFVTSLNRTASEVMRTVYEREPFPTTAVDLVTPGRRIRRAAHYMAAMGLWRPTSAPVFPGPISVSSCNSCMTCEDCFPDGRSEQNYLMTRKEPYIRTLNNVYVIFGYDIPCCSRVVILDYIVVLVSSFYWGFFNMSY